MIQSLLRLLNDYVRLVMTKTSVTKAHYFLVQTHEGWIRPCSDAVKYVKTHENSLSLF